MRRTPEEIAADLDAKSAKLKADADRRRSVASDTGCELMYDAEKALRALAAYMGVEGADYTQHADILQAHREARWSKLKAIMEQAKEPS